MVRRSVRYGYIGSLYFHIKTDSIILFDLYPEITYKGIKAADIDILLGTRKRYKNFFVASEGCEAAVTLPKELLMFGRVKEGERVRERIFQCVNKDPNNFVGCISHAFGEKLTRQLLMFALQKDWSSIEKIHKETRSFLISRAFVKRPLLQTIQWLNFLKSHLLQKLRQNTGFFVVAVGPDGVGKTTISQGLISSLRKNVFKDSIYIHKDFGFLPQLKYIKRLWFFNKKIIPSVQKPNKYLSGMVKHHSLLRSLVYVLYYFFDFLFGYLVIANARGKECLVIADRYFYDYFYQLSYSNVPWLLLRLLSYLVPKPDLLLFLYADAEIISKRKQELTINEIQRQNKMIEKLCNQFKFTIKVDTNISPEGCIKIIKRQVFLKMAMRQKENRGIHLNLRSVI